MPKEEALPLILVQARELVEVVLTQSLFMIKMVIWRAYGLMLAISAFVMALLRPLVEVVLTLVQGLVLGRGRQLMAG